MRYTYIKSNIFQSRILINGDKIFKHYLQIIELESVDYDYSILQIQGSEAVTAYKDVLYLAQVGSKITASAKESNAGDIIIEFEPSGQAEIQLIYLLVSEKTHVTFDQSSNLAMRTFRADEINGKYIAVIDKDELLNYGDDLSIELEIIVQLSSPHIYRYQHSLEDLLDGEIEIFMFQGGFN